MATGGCTDTSDEIFNFKCTPCAKTNKYREAGKYCVECQGYCCQACADIHERFPTLEGHHLLDKSNFKTAGLTSDLPEIPTVRCKVHKVKVMDMYCENHDVVGCTSCMALTHRSCTDVHLIPDVINTIFKKADIDSTFEKLQENIKHLQKIKDERISLLKELTKSKTEAINAIREFRQEMEMVLQNLQKEAINEVEEMYGKNKSTIEEEKKKAESEIDSMKKAVKEMQHSETNKAQQFVNMKIAQENVANAGGIITSMETPTNVNIIFQEDANVRDSLCRLRLLGTVEQMAHAYTIKDTSEIDVSLKDDSSTCNILSSCLTETDMLLLVDNGNKRLKRVDIARMSVVDHCDLPCSPYLVCSVRQYEAAVCISNQSIQFVTLAKQMTRSHQFNLGHNCYGIAYKADKLYVTDNGRYLYIYDMTGKQLHKISNDTSGNQIFKNSEQVIFNDSGDKVLIVDWSNRIISMDANGKYINTVEDSNIKCAHGVCTDGRGNIFVCGYGSSDIIQFGENGKKLGVVLTSSYRLAQLWSICFDPRRCIMFVAFEGSNRLKIFNLQ